MKHELTVFLDYEPYDREGFHSGNSRNGYYDRTFKTEYGELHLRIPRDRNGQFQQQTIAPYKRSNDTLEQFVIHLYEKGMTTNEIAHLIERMYGSLIPRGGVYVGGWEKQSPMQRLHPHTERTTTDLFLVLAGRIPEPNQRELRKDTKSRTSCYRCGQLN